MVRESVERDSNWKVADCLAAALILEASAYPKPGLVDRYRGVKGTSFTDFVFSILALHRRFAMMAELGSREGIRGGVLGEEILKSVKEMLAAQRGGNTHLGAILLQCPIAYVSGYLIERRMFSMRDLRSYLRKLMSRLDWRDTEHVFKAISLASPGGLGKVPFLDVNDPATYELLRRRRPKLIEALKPYVGRDLIVDELLSGYEVTFEVCVPTLRRYCTGSNVTEQAVLSTLLTLLSKVTDTHIVRRKGIYMARMVRSFAENVVKSGSTLAVISKKLIELDSFMRRYDLRPGAVADVLGAGLSVHLLTSLGSPSTSLPSSDRRF